MAVLPGAVAVRGSVCNHTKRIEYKKDGEEFRHGILNTRKEDGGKYGGAGGKIADSRWLQITPMGGELGKMMNDEREKCGAWPRRRHDLSQIWLGCSGMEMGWENGKYFYLCGALDIYAIQYNPPSS